MRQFEKLLSKTQLTRAEAGNRAFDSAFCRPRSGPLRDRWEMLRARRETPTSSPEAVAQTLLLSYGAEFGGSLWLLEATGPQQRDVALSARAQRGLERATLLVSRELPALVGARRTAAAWSIARLHTGGETVLDGESFGLSMCLAAAAHCLGLPSPSTVAASAVVDGDGTLFEVGGLAEKLRVLHDWALGIETIIVAANQFEQAALITRELGALWRVVSARTVADAIVTAFPNLWSDLGARWNQPAKLAQVAGDLFRLARDGSNQVLSWKGIEDAAERVLAGLPAESPAAKDARFAYGIARRHEGHDALLDFDHRYLADMRRPLRLRCLAHIIQSHADCAEIFDPAIERAVADLLPSDARGDSVDDLWLSGAIGRMLAAFFHYERAEVSLRRAVVGWFELDRVPEASHALCELLRVVALTDQHHPFSQLEREFAEPFLMDPRCDGVSRAFVLYALGRGHALLGKNIEAQRRLSDPACDWTLVPEHLRAFRLRWLARVLRDEGNTAGVHDCTRQLARALEREPALRVVAVLAELDRPRQEHVDPGEPLRAFENCKPREYRRFLAMYDLHEIATRVAREYRY